MEAQHKPVHCPGCRSRQVWLLKTAKCDSGPLSVFECRKCKRQFTDRELDRLERENGTVQQAT